MITTFARSLPYAQHRTHSVSQTVLCTTRARSRRHELRRREPGELARSQSEALHPLPRRGRPSFHLRMVAGRQTPTLPMRRSGLGICSRAT